MKRYIITLLLTAIAYSESPIEMVPYRIVPMSDICDMRIEFINPSNLDSMYQADKVELMETLKERGEQSSWGGPAWPSMKKLTLSSLVFAFKRFRPPKIRCLSETPAYPLWNRLPGAVPNDFLPNRLLKWHCRYSPAGTALCTWQSWHMLVRILIQASSSSTCR